MCGILGFYNTSFEQSKSAWYKELVTKLFLLSESRGKEAAGIALADDHRIDVLRAAQPASKFVASPEFNRFFDSFLGSCVSGAPISAIGHARLVTNGLQDNLQNNQPVTRDGVALVHNGIILNEAALWEDMSKRPEAQLDSEVIAAALAEICENSCPADTVKRFFTTARGSASIGFFLQKLPGLFVYTNNASIYYAQLDQLFIFASERIFLQQLLKTLKKSLPNARPGVISRLGNNALLWATATNGQLTLDSGKDNTAPIIWQGTFRRMEERTRDYAKARAEIRRCTRCILPETMPFINFDEKGVCNYCRDYIPMPMESREAALATLAQKKKPSNPEADCLCMLSGGRDSCYGLHYAVKELGLKPIAYTYDWGMVTDIARRNAALMCGELGVEHIIVSADIAWKRANVRKNLTAWLKKPELGMIPILMAGDKQYFYYAEQVRKANDLPLTLVSENPLEMTRFKAGFCGVDESGYRLYDVPLKRKLRLLTYYAGRYFTNPWYINSTLLDNAFAFASSYLIKHDLFPIFRYKLWNEEEVNSVLAQTYGWEKDPEAKSTWRIGDGTAAFYNYAYHVMAGLTENDTLRSNQIREGMLDRETALAAAQAENEPRWNSMRWYAETIGFNLEEAVLSINCAPKLYR